MMFGNGYGIGRCFGFGYGLMHGGWGMIMMAGFTILALAVIGVILLLDVMMPGIDGFEVLNRSI